METTLRVMVADDSVLFREGVARLLVEAGFTVTARVGDAAALLECVRADPPDVAIVDIRMPPPTPPRPGRGAHAARRSCSGVLVLSATAPTVHCSSQVRDRRAGLLEAAGRSSRSCRACRMRRSGLVIDPSVIRTNLPQAHPQRWTTSPTTGAVLAAIAEGRSWAICRGSQSEAVGGACARCSPSSAHQVADDSRRVLAVLATSAAEVDCPGLGGQFCRVRRGGATAIWWLTEVAAWAWDRHHNVLSWYIRPLFLLPFCFFAYRRNVAGIVVTLVALVTSMAWFPAPAQPDPAVVQMLEVERDYLLGEWTLGKIVIALLVPVVFGGIAVALWRRSIGWALVVINALFQSLGRTYARQ